MLFKNATVFTPGCTFARADVKTNGEKIEAVGQSLDGNEAIDLDGCYLLPGFIDIHIHGSAGVDCCDGTPEAIEKLSAYLVTKGVTSFTPASMSLPAERLDKVFQNLKACMDNPPSGAYIHGVNMEGPYFSQEKKGAQNGDYIHAPNLEEFNRLNEKNGRIVRLVDIAPEQPGAEQFTREACKVCTVSIAHTTATYEQAKEALLWGATNATHLFNAMPSLLHRAPGVPGAVFEGGFTAELISDGMHLHPAIVRLVFKVLDDDKPVLISDAMSAAGMPEGKYSLGGLEVFVKGDGAARLADGTLAGSTANILQCVQNAVKFGVPMEKAVRAATINPASVIGADKTTGSLKAGKFADLIVLDKALNLKFAMVKGDVKVNTLA